MDSRFRGNDARNFLVILQWSAGSSVRLLSAGSSVRPPSSFGGPSVPSIAPNAPRDGTIATLSSFRTPRSGDPESILILPASRESKMDSRFRGNDAGKIFGLPLPLRLRGSDAGKIFGLPLPLRLRGSDAGKVFGLPLPLRLRGSDAGKIFRLPLPLRLRGSDAGKVFGSPWSLRLCGNEVRHFQGRGDVEPLSLRGRGRGEGSVSPGRCRLAPVPNPHSPFRGTFSRREKGNAVSC
jgi:hypothetical protein